MASHKSVTRSSLNKRFLEAASEGNLAEMKSTLDEGADINAKGTQGYTALIEAAYWDKPLSFAEFLIDRGANIEARDSQGCTALIRAAVNGNVDMIGFLLRKGAKIDPKDNDGRTALMHAARLGRYEGALNLIRHGANIEERDNARRTPLMEAAWMLREDTLKLLLENGANHLATNEKGETAQTLGDKKMRRIINRHIRGLGEAEEQQKVLKRREGIEEILDGLNRDKI